jgi:hypothetical protein
MNLPVVPVPAVGVVDCEPELQIASSTVYYLRNRKKRRNFYVENIPKDKTGCSGSWLFRVAWDYFVQDQKVAIKGVRGDWTSGDNLDIVNRLTAGGRTTLEQASKQTWTYQLAKSKGFSRFQCINTQGSPGQYKSVDVVFLP